MKTIKPQRLSLLSRTYEQGGTFHFSVAAILFFDLTAPRRILTEVSLWKALPPELGKDAALDVAMPKARAEYLVTGYAFPPGGKPAIACAPSVALGALRKTLRVVGDRTWTVGGATEPAPFQRMSLGWENAFGGEGYERNPLGKGRAPLPGSKVHPLPNLEDPQSPITSPRDRPAPAGFGPIDVTWPQRAGKQGTFDKHWLEAVYPGHPADLDWTFFNVAPEDQWQEKPFQPDEAFQLDFFHPEKSRIEGRLPGAVPRCLVSRRGVPGEEGAGLTELPVVLDTVWFFPHLLRGVMIFHGAIAVAEDDGADVLHLVAAIEEAGKPRPVEHYRKVLADRLDKDRDATVLLREGDLVPDWPGLSALLDPDPGEPKVEELGLLGQNQRRARDEGLRQLHGELASAGVDPKVLELHSTDPEELLGDVSPDDPVQLVANLERTVAKAEELRAKAEDELARQKETFREHLRARGIDPATILDQPAPGGPPEFDAKRQLEELRAARGSPLPDEEKVREGLLGTERQLRDAYRMGAHHLAPAAAKAPDVASGLREVLCAAVAAGESLDGRDFTGADLGGVSLAGANLAGAFLEGARLAGANLQGADLSRAVLARADLSGADLSGAKLRAANLGAATLREARLCRAELREAVLAKADLSRADLGEAELDQADLAEAVLQGASLSGVRAVQLHLRSVDLSGVRLCGADLTKAVFLECSVEGADLSGARLATAVFVKARGRRAAFRGAQMAGVCCADGCDFEEADLREAVLDGANLRGSNLARAQLSGARLSGADLSEADLRGAAADGICARGSRWVRANLEGAVLARADLLGAVLQKANLSGANLALSNLYQADLARVAVLTRVELAGANLKRVRVQPSRGR